MYGKFLKMSSLVASLSLALTACGLDSPLGQVETLLGDQSAVTFIETEITEGRELLGLEAGIGPDGRPQLSGSPLVLGSEHFAIHYTTSGRDAVPLADNDGNGHPDYVDETARAMEHVWNAEINQYGWAAPPSDGTLGGDGRYDVYLENIFSDGTSGYSDGGWPETLVGDNPNSAPVETRASISFLALDNDYAELSDFVEPDSTETPLGLMRSTAAHEFLHAIQFGYDGEEPAEWLWEASATWIQDEVYDDINDGNEDLLAVFDSPDTCLLAYGGEQRVEDENHWYGMWILLRHVSERYGHGAVRGMWEHARSQDSYAAIDAALAEHGTTLEDEFRSFGVALLTRSFEEGASYPTVRLTGQAGVGTFTPDDGVGQLAMDYVQITGAGTVTVSVSGSGMEGLLVGVSGGQAHVYNMPGNQASVDANAFDELYLIVLNLSRAGSESECAFAPYTVNVSQGGAPQAAAYSLSVPNFLAPDVRSLLDPGDYYEHDDFNEDDDYYDDGEYFEEVAAPAELVPGYVPDGYVYGGSYLMDSWEFGPLYEAIWYVPDGGTATVVDYFDSSDGYVSVVGSASPYPTIDSWLDDAGFDPYPEEVHIIDGVTVIIVDWSDDLGPYSSANYVLDGQFVSVEGTISASQMTRVVESLLY